MQDTPETVPYKVQQLPQHLSSNNVNGRAKWEKLNTYFLHNPMALNVHETYSFVSQKQGFTAHGSYVTIQPASISSVKTRDLLTAHFDNDISDCTGIHVEPDYVAGPDLEDHSKHKCMAGVSHQFHTVPQLI
jgi:hypothetical protein